MSIHGDKQLQTIREYYQRIRDDSQDQYACWGYCAHSNKVYAYFLKKDFHIYEDRQGFSIVPCVKLWGKSNYSCLN